MTDLLSDVETPSDAELISRVRGGDVAAYGDLFSRHKDAAGRLARQLVRGPDSDDLVSEAFAKVLSVLQGGGGPDVAFRAYLLTAVRRLHVDRVRSGQRLQTTDDMTPFDPGVPFQDTAVAGFESGAAAKAFASLPERWQLVLWHLEVEGQKPADIAPLLGMSANSVSALAYRAREGLRQAFLTMHIADLTETDCRWVNEHLGAFIRKGLSKRDTAKVQEHLDGCRRCTAMYLELTDVNSNLAGIIAPLLLGAAASGYLASSGAGAAGVLGLLSRVKDFVAANSGAVTAAGVTVGVATAAAVAAVALNGGGSGPKDVVADPPASVGTPAASAPSLPAQPTKQPSKQPPGQEPSQQTGTTTAPEVAPTPTVTASADPTAVAGIPGPLGGSTDPSTDTDTGTGTGTDTGTGTGTDPGATTSSVDLSGTTIDEQGVHLVATGSPDLPPTLTVRLTSNPDGVTFAPSQDCEVSPDGSSATCSTVSGAGARTPGTAMLAPSTYSAELPFLFPDGQLDTDIAIAVDVPDGFEVAGGSGGVKPYTSRTADVRLSLPDTVPYATGGSAVAAQVSGLPSGYAGPVRLSLVDGAATITDTSTDGCAVDAGVATCPRPADGVVTVTLVPTDPTQDSAVRLRVAPVSGYRDPAGGNNTSATTLVAAPVPPKDVDVTLVSLAPSDARPGPGDVYTLGGLVTVDGPSAADLSAIRYTITGGSFVAGDDCTATECTMTTTGAPSFVVTPDDPAAVSSVTITAHVPDGFRDTDPSDDTAGATLRRYDVSLTGLAVAAGTADAQGDQTFTATVDDDGLANVGYGLADPAATDHLQSVQRTGDTVTFVVRSSAGAAHPVALVATLPTGYTDRDAGNNTTGPATWAPATDVDVALSGLPTSAVRPGPNDTYAVSGLLSVTGPAASRVQDVTYTVTGAQFVVGGSTTGTVTRPASETSPAFVLTRQGSGTATITASAPGFTETDGADNAAAVELRAYDVRLTRLTAAPGTADASGNQTFTAHLDRDGYAGSLTYDLVGAADLSTGAPSVAGDTLTFTVHSTRTDQGSAPVQVRADLPTGYTDAAPSNNTTGTATYTYYVTPPPVDVVLASLTRTAVKGPTNTVSAVITGVPASTTKLEIRMSGADVGDAADKVRFLTGENGASGSGDVDCVASSAVLVTCTRLTGSFTVEMDVHHPPGKPAARVTMTVTAVGGGEPGTSLANNSRAVTVDDD